MGLDRRNMFPYWWQGRPSDLPLDPNYRVRSDYLNANARAIAEAIGIVLITGDMATESNVHYGSSIATECRLTLPDDYTEIGDILMVADATRQWRIPAIVYENEIYFSDTHLVKGSSGGNDYDTIQNNLIMWTLSKTKLEKTVTKNEIVTGAFDDGLHGDDIRMSKTDATTVAAKASLIDVEHESNGVHSAGIIGNDNLDKDDVMSSQGFINRVKNSDFVINDAASRDYWLDVLTPVVTPTSSACDVFPDYFCQIATNQLNEGIRQLLKGFETDQPVTCVFWAKGNAGGEEIYVRLNTAAETATQTITLTTTWTKYTVALTPDSQCSFYVNFLADTASSITWMIAKISVYLGDIKVIPERNPQDSVVDAVMTKTFFAQTTLYAANQIIAKWTLERACKIVNAKAYLIGAVGSANLVVRLTDGITNYDTTVSLGNNEGEQTADQEYPTASNMEVIIVGDAARDGGTDLTIVYQYRTV